MSLLDDIPLSEAKNPEALLGIDPEKYPDGDHDFYKHGWLEFEDQELILSDKYSEGYILKRCMVVVLHSTDNPPKEKYDIELGFWIDGNDVSYLEEEIEARTSLNKFLKLRIHEIVEECEKRNITNLVLCVCNPHNAKIKRPKEIPSNINVYMPQGIVEHWRILISQNDKYVSKYELNSKTWIKV